MNTVPVEWVPSLWASLPFAGLLLAIAILPLIPRAASWWHNNWNRLLVSLGCAALTLGYYGVVFGAESILPVLHHSILEEYVPFISLLFALYVISGGIRLSGDLPAHPLTNTGFLALGSVLANLIGTTGASMLLIRPLLATNSERRHVVHTVVFFIFLVSNVGGCLLPIGDPPLFLGYLRGVPFLWTLQLWPEWATMTILLLAIYYVWDRFAYAKESTSDISRDETRRVPLQLEGGRNFVLLAAVVLCVALVRPGEPLPGLAIKSPHFLREILLFGLVLLSLQVTPRGLRKKSGFNYAPIGEVAALFVGIFICLQAPIQILKGNSDTLGSFLSSPQHFFWATGLLSGFLDNAPTYALFLEAATSISAGAGEAIVVLADGGIVDAKTLAAVSLGAVFMGANTYIGNGPNFMVKSIAEQSGVKMPSFFGYMLYSMMILLPLFVFISMVFLR